MFSSVLATVTPAPTGWGKSLLVSGKRLPVKWEGLPLLWSPDGWIYLMRGKELWRVRHDPGAEELYASLPQECLWWEQPSLDQRANRMVCTVQDYESDIWVGTDFDPEGET